jgi:ABC-2 type transport system permease protein
VNFEQLKTILWLRWRLTRNQWTRSRGLGAVITGLVALITVVFGVMSFGGGLLGGLFGLREAKPVLILGVWFGVTAGFLFFWLIGLVNEIQRSESIDLQRLMHLPVALGQIFIINYLTSLLTLSIVLMVPGMIGLASGLAISRGAAMLLLIPLSLSMVFMITAWTYLLRGWLASLMANPRRRRTVIMGITFAFIMISQAPNLYFNIMGGDRRHSPAGASRDTQDPRSVGKPNGQHKLEQLLIAAKFIPPLWVPVGAGALAEGRALPALLGTVGCFAIGALGLRRAYRSTLRFYHGETGKKSAVQPKLDRAQSGRSAPVKAGVRFLELQLPAVPEQAAALTLATFRSMLRAPEVKMAWASSFFVTLIIGASFLLRSPPKIPEAAKPFIATGAVVFSIFMLVQFFANQFGFDRDGFRALVLSPAPRRLILLGKNLACLPAGAGFGLFLLALLSVWLRLSPIVLLAALLQLASLLLLAGLVGNLLSILAPYRIQPGSMKPTKMPGLAMLLMVLCHLFFPLAMLPVFLPPLAELLWRQAGWPAAVPVNLLLSVVIAALIGLAYWQALGPLGRLLQRRETKILAIVTVEVE